ncbi:hypothetical protein EG68_01746 [Paragonimus skrjabini miyazakii]|uniref:Uncharacterized protein n=1 Tax=Paragonimus skrjabini miyazakii TaxID=59628 RepID=A0A8S9Z0J6_9TREM|nr:hypothetical protein EG68_01746 [Paragonimus skrjabini miyazakii]
MFYHQQPDALIIIAVDVLDTTADERIQKAIHEARETLFLSASTPMHITDLSCVSAALLYALVDLIILFEERSSVWTMKISERRFDLHCQ